MQRQRLLRLQTRKKLRTVMNTLKSITRLMPANAPVARFLLVFALAEIAVAQTSTRWSNDNGEVIVLAKVSVTGSNIKRIDEEKTLPVTTFTSDDIRARDSATPADLLIGIPEITNIPANETATNAVAARGDNANISLRGLGASTTLVLLNGRRMPMHPFNTSSVNVNTLPTFGVQQVEVLRDGASAVYGSDAVAGVVNYVTRKDPQGGEYSFRYGLTEHGGGTDEQGNLGFGTTFAGGKGSVLINFSAYNRDPIFLWQRESSQSSDRHATARAPWNVPGGAYDNLSTTSIWAQYRVGAGVTSGTIRYFYPTDGTPTGTPALSNVAPPRSLYADYNQYITGQPRSSRFNTYNRVEYDLTPAIRVYGEIVGYYSASRVNRQPMALQSSDAVVTVSADNPFNPLGSRFYSPTGAANADGTARLTGTPQPITIAAVLFPDGGAEKQVQSDVSYRALTGLKGTLGTSSWTWDTGLSYGAVHATDFLVNSIRQSYIQQVALRTDTTAWNPFGYTFKVAGNSVVADKPYSNPQSVRDAYTQSLNRYGRSKLPIVDAHLGGKVIDLWSGPVAAAFGAEWRREFKADTKDPFAGTNPPGSGLDPQDNDFLTTSPKFNYSASRTIESAYTETLIPLAAPRNHLPGLDSLELNASARYEKYSDFGSTTKPKYGLSWKPLHSVLIRASINEGYDAPDLATLYQPTSFSNSAPPGSRDTVRNNILLSASLPADNQVLSKSYSIGNPALQPEESKGKSIGLVVDVPWVKGLTLSVDYWQIRQNSLVSSIGRDTALDAQLLQQYTQQQLAAGVPIQSINVGSRITPTDTTGGYVGDPNTLRAAVTDGDRALLAQTWAVLPKSQWTAALGQWIGSISTSINGTGVNFSNGLDYGLSYSLPKTRFGQFRFSTQWAQFLKKQTQSTPTSPINDSIVGLNTAEWKGSTTLQWRQRNWSTSLSGTYIGPTRTGATTTQSVYDSLGRPSYIRVVTTNGSTSYVEIGDDQIQLNASITYHFGPKGHGWLKDSSVRLGINNLLDAQPTLSTSSTGYSGATGESVWVGRAYSVEIHRSF
jgi:outer membrane receptor protein involved in Fe transport